MDRSFLSSSLKVHGLCHIIFYCLSQFFIRVFLFSLPKKSRRLLYFPLLLRFPDKKQLLCIISCIYLINIKDNPVDICTQYIQCFFFLRELWLEENCKLRSVRRKMRVCAIERIKHFLNSIFIQTKFLAVFTYVCLVCLPHFCSY